MKSLFYIFKMSLSEYLVTLDKLEWQNLEKLINNGDYRGAKTCIEGCMYCKLNLFVNLLGMKLINYSRRMVCLMEKQNMEMGDA